MVSVEIFSHRRSNPSSGYTTGHRALHPCKQTRVKLHFLFICLCFLCVFPHFLCCSLSSSPCSSLRYQCGTPKWQNWSLCQSVLGSFFHKASQALCLAVSPLGKKRCMIFAPEVIVKINREASYHLKPVMETVWAILWVNTLNVEEVGEVQRDGEAIFHRNNILTGQWVWWKVWIARTGQVSLWLIENSIAAGYWERGKRKYIKS